MLALRCLQSLVILEPKKCINPVKPQIKGPRDACDLWPVCPGYTASLESKIWTRCPADHQRCMLQRSMGCLVVWSWSTKLSQSH